jgi:predicted AAA+ superfamily ATPase
MKRKIYDKLLFWKRNHAGKYALLVEGARRVGKSWIVEEFAKREYTVHLVIDFAKANRRIKELFEEKLDNLDEFFMLLQAQTRTKLVRGDSLIVFDEVQRFPRAREAIKYLVADGRYHYIETGSLVSIKRNVENIVIPSEEMRIQLHPMDFEEFLWAKGADSVADLIRARFAGKMPMEQSNHRMAMELFRQYVVVGGMPQAVEAFADGSDIGAAETAKRAILDLYADDIGKFAGRLKNKVRAIWGNIPGALSSHEKHFKPGAVKAGSKMRELDSPFEWLDESMTVNIASNVTAPNAGLKMSEDRELIKCYMADTGLLVSHAFSENADAVPEMQWKILTGKLEVNKGMLIENVVAQMLRAAGQRLFFYFNSGSGESKNRMEIDFLLSKSKVSARHNIHPVEVKSSSNYSTSSLDKFRKAFSKSVARPIILHPGDACFKQEVIRLPLYMASLVPEIDL